MRHNNVRDFEVNLVKTTFNDTEIESNLQKIDKEGLNGLFGDNAIPDKRARGVWGQEKKSFLTYVW